MQEILPPTHCFTQQMGNIQYMNDVKEGETVHQIDSRGKFKLEFKVSPDNARNT